MSATPIFIIIIAKISKTCYVAYILFYLFVYIGVNIYLISCLKMGAMGMWFKFLSIPGNEVRFIRLCTLKKCSLIITENNSVS